MSDKASPEDLPEEVEFVGSVDNMDKLNRFQSETPIAVHVKDIDQIMIGRPTPEVPDRLLWFSLPERQPVTAEMIYEAVLILAGEVRTLNELIQGKDNEDASNEGQ